MKINEVLEIIKSFSYNQGFYGRLYNAIMELDDIQFNKFKTEIENQNFNNPLDVVLYFEC